MSAPIIIVAGKAGSGKDTVAAHIVKHYNAVSVAQADPMKQLAAKLFGFNELQLWGPSEERNKPASVTFNAYDDNTEIARTFCADMGLTDAAVPPLLDWYNGQVEEWRKNFVLAPRTVLQTLGTEWGREQEPRMWIERAIKTCRTLLEGGHSYTRAGGLVKDGTSGFDYAVVTDGRFRNEVLAVKLVGGVSLRVIRPTQDTATVGIAGHRSEKELDTIPENFYTGSIMNDASLDHLYHLVDEEMVIHFGDIRNWKTW